MEKAGRPKGVLAFFCFGYTKGVELFLRGTFL